MEKDSNETTVEVAIFGVNYHIDMYDEYVPILRNIIGNRFLSFTPTQLKFFKNHIHAVAREFGYSDLIIIERVPEESIVEKINEIAAKAEKQHIRDEEKRRKDNEKAKEVAKKKAAAKAKKAIEKARKTLAELGEAE